MGQMSNPGVGTSQWLRPRSADSIVERQIRLWNLQQRARRDAPRVSSRWPIVTISREFGAQGALIGEQLAQRLGFALWDRRVIETLARMVHGSEKDVVPLEERALGAVEEFLSQLLLFTEVPSAEYREALRLLVGTLEQHGSAVIVGRGASFMVDPIRALRLRLTAPLEYRVRTYAEREGLSLGEAERAVIRADRERRAYLERIVHAHPEDPLNYDLVLNVAAMPVDHVVDTLLAAYRARFGRLPSGALRAALAARSSPSLGL